MGVGKNNKNIIYIMSIISVIVYYFFLYISMEWLYEHNMLTPIKHLNGENIHYRFFEDVWYASIPLFVFILTWKKRKFYNGILKQRKICVGLIICLAVSFIIKGDFTICGIYKLFFYLIFVGAIEEFVFRGYLYHILKYRSRKSAIVISGMLWGVFHAMMPAILQRSTLLDMLLNMVNYIGGGIVMGYLFIYLQEKSETILIPILLHANLDYSVGHMGSVLFIIIIIFFKLNLNNALKINNTEINFQKHHKYKKD